MKYLTIPDRLQMYCSIHALKIEERLGFGRMVLSGRQESRPSNYLIAKLRMPVNETATYVWLSMESLILKAFPFRDCSTLTTTYLSSGWELYSRRFS